MTTGRIFDIKRFSIHDGPGIRTTVFLQGCPLSCPWCHNPESQSLFPFVHYDRVRCMGCETCVEACPEHALQRFAEGIRTDEELCQRCGQCVDVCPTASRALIGRTVSVDHVMAEIEKDRPYYDESGGGVTFSGGEPLLQPAFLLAALAGCGAHDIHRTVDTAGLSPRDVLDAVAAETDLFLYDLKLMDEARHCAATGTTNVGILANLEHLVATGAELRVRIPLIHGINDDDGNIDASSAYLQTLESVRHVDLLPFHRPAADKHRKFGVPWRMNGDATTPDERLQEIVTRFADAGFVVTIGG